MTKNQSSAISTYRDNNVSKLSRQVFWGAGIGVVSSLTMLFVIVFFYGQSLGLSIGQCTLLGCLTTILLSQPAGVVGILAGAGVGVLCGLAGYWHRHK
ncbi:MAG: hypothetical protein QNJ14_00475 [Woeseiaceae bacterium]|nr:hypothetical protein [Woeseiaceae bacterium]